MSRLTMGLLALALASGTVLGADQINRTYYTDAKMAALARNLEQYDWARQERDRILGRANKWLKYDDAKLRTLVPPPEIPRAIRPHDMLVHVGGAAVYPSSWQVSFDMPWKLTSPQGKVYPSNDFWSFYQSGLDANGTFDPERADRSLLTGPFPDDGWGCIVPGEKRNDKVWFVAHYAHNLAKYWLMPALEDLSRAHLITGDTRYAHACALLLWQLAEYYPRYFYETQAREGKDKDSSRPISYPGRLLYYTWEALYTAQTVPPAYDAIRSAIEKDEALMRLTGQSAAEIRARIEERMLRTMVNDIMAPDGNRITGNFGLPHLALLRLAMVLRGDGRKPSSDEMINNWVVSNPNTRGGAQNLGIDEALACSVYRDGYPLESVGYNNLHLTSYLALVDLLDEQRRLKFVETERFRNLFVWPLKMICAGEFLPPLGDTADFFHTALWQPHSPTNREVYEGAYRLYKDPLFAKALLHVAKGGNRTGDLFHDGIPDEELREAAAKHPEPLGVTSELLPGVGFATLQTGTEANRTALAVFYGYYHAHGHADRLGLNIYSRRNAVLGEFGAVVGTEDPPMRHGFVTNSVTHNTVVVNGRRQEYDRGRLHVFDPGRFVQLLEVSAEACYPQTATLYRRTLMLVDVTPDKAYVVDIFRVRGGSQHDWIVHGTQAEFASDIAFGPPRKAGTLAGPDVPYGYCYDDPKNTGQRGYFDYKGSGFQWLFNVQQACLDGTRQVNWRLNRSPDLYPHRPTEGVVLRAHLLPDHGPRDSEQVFACDGIPRRGGDFGDVPKNVKFVVRRRAGPDLESTFVTVFEPYKAAPFIRSVRLLPAAATVDLPVALEIDCGEKRHIVFNRIEAQKGEASTVKLGNGITLDARAAVLEKDAAGQLSQLYLLDDGGSSGLPEAVAPSPMRRAKVERVDYTKGEVVLDAPILSRTSPAGNLAIVESTRHANAVRVASVLSDNRFSVGSDDLSAATVQVQDVKDGQIHFLPRYVHYVEPGMSVVNESGRVVGRVTSVSYGASQLEAAVTLADFPDVNNDGRRTARIMVLGPQDTCTVHVSSRVAEMSR